jgi:ligand-binding sensor domain-containing protein
MPIIGNTSRSMWRADGDPASMRWFHILLVATMLCHTPGRAAESVRIPNYKHTVLTSDQGAPAPVYDIAQTTDGYLWISSHYGLWRYDGVEFEHVRLSDRLPRRSTQLRKLFADREGNLWIGHDWGGLTLYRNGKFQDVMLSANPGQPLRMVQDARGRVWILCSGAGGTRLWRYDRGRIENLTTRIGLGGQDALNMMMSRNGTIWLALTSGVAYLRPNEKRITIMRGERTGDYPGMVEAADGSVWLADTSQVRQLWDGMQSHTPAISPPRMRFPVSAEAHSSARDRSGTVWVGASLSGLTRLPAFGRDFTGAAVQLFPARELSSPVINTMLVDREENIWLGTNLGLDKFRPVSIFKALSYKQETFNYGKNGSSVLRGPRGVVLVKAGGLFNRVKDNGYLQPLALSGSKTVGACVDSSGSIWLRQNGSLINSAGGGAIRIPVDHDGVWAPSCALGAKDWWITSVDGLFHLEKSGAWRRFALDAENRGIRGPQVIGLDHTGNLIAYFGNGRTFRVTKHGKQLIWPKNGPLSFINFMEKVGEDLLIGGTKGLARLGPRGVQLLTRDRYPLLDEVSGLAVQQGGKAWLAVRSGIVSVSAKSLLAAFDSPGRPLPFREYGPQDGLDAASYVEFENSLALDGVGRLWIATSDGVFKLDPARLNRNDLPPPLVIKSFKANGRVWAPGDNPILPKGTSQLQIDFTAPSLRDPGRVRFKYRLRGHDREWTDAGTRRQAIYTDLAPGSYDFQVVAANEDGVWNNKGASLSFTIPPTFLQSQLFHLLCGLFLVLLAAALYRLRLRQIGARIEARLTERMGERERIARELHDTLLQGVQGLIIGLQNYADDLPGDAPARSEINRSLDRADDLLAESRDRVHDLRRSTQARSLPEALTLLGKRTLAGTGTEIRSAVVGEERDLHPVVAEELLRLSEEALFNIHKHAQASRVTIGVTFGKRQLMLRLEDDGVGLPEDLTRHIPSRRHFHVANRAEAGTLVQVTIPASAAYAEEHHVTNRAQQLARWLRRLKPADTSTYPVAKPQT